MIVLFCFKLVIWFKTQLNQSNRVFLDDPKDLLNTFMLYLLKSVFWWCLGVFWRVFWEGLQGYVEMCSAHLMGHRCGAQRQKKVLRCVCFFRDVIERCFQEGLRGEKLIDKSHNNLHLVIGFTRLCDYCLQLP